MYPPRFLLKLQKFLGLRCRLDRPNSAFRTCLRRRWVHQLSSGHGDPPTTTAKWFHVCEHESHHAGQDHVSHKAPPWS